MQADKLVAFLRSLFFKNGYWKLLSLIIAVLIHFSIRSEISHLRVVTIPVVTDFDANTMGAAIESVEPRSVQITLRGAYSEVNELDVSKAGCVVRPKQKKNSLRDTVPVKVRGSNLRGVRGVRVVKIEPSVVVVKFDVPMSLQLAVAPPVVQGKARGRVQLVYDQTNAVVKGSRRLLSPLDAGKVQIQTDMIDVEGRSQTFTTRIRLYPPGDAVNAIVEPSDMVVNVMIISEKATAKIEHVPVVVSQPAASANRWVTVPECVDVEVTGRSEVVKAITFGQIIASVNGNIPVTPLSETNEVPVIVHVQQGLSIDEAQAVPSTVKLIPISQPPPGPKSADAQDKQ